MERGSKRQNGAWVSGQANEPGTDVWTTGVDGHGVSTLCEKESRRPAELSDAIMGLTRELEKERRKSQQMGDNLKMLIRKYKKSKTVALRRHIGYFAAIGMLIGGMTGTGNFISPKGVLEGAGSVGLSLIIWVACIVLVAFGAMCYAELGTTIQQSGGEYIYLLKGLGAFPAFVYSWVSFIGRRPSSFALMALVVAEYAAMPIFGKCGPPIILTKALAILVLVSVGIMNSWSVKFTARVQVVVTVFKLSLLVLIIVGGLIKFIKGHTTNFERPFEGQGKSAGNIAIAFYNGLYAFNGWSFLNYVTEEVKNPVKTLPRALITAVLVVGVTQMGTCISYFIVLTKSEILQSSSFVVLWGERILGSASLLIPIGAAICVLGELNAVVYTVSRIPYIAAREDHLPSVLSFIQVKCKTPVLSILLTNMMAVIMVIVGDIYQLINILGSLDWLFFGLTMVSLLITRKQRKDKDNAAFKVPIVLPIVVLLSSCYLVIAPLIHSPKPEFLYTAALLACGILLYIPFVHCKVRFSWFDNLTAWIQCVTETVPAEEGDFDH